MEYRNGCLPDRWVMKDSSLAFPSNNFLSVSMFMYKCYLMLISVNTVDPTFTFILCGARVQGNFTTCRATLEVSHNFRYGNTSMAILLDVNWYMPSQKLGV